MLFSFAECDGSGEPNIEPQVRRYFLQSRRHLMCSLVYIAPLFIFCALFFQFLEWVEEGGESAKCPYCDGLGFVTCDACEGRKVAEI